MDFDRAVRRYWLADEREELTMDDLEIDIRLNRTGLHVNTNGTGEDILKGLALIALDVTTKMDAKNANVLRAILCDMIMSAPKKVD